MTAPSPNGKASPQAGDGNVSQVNRKFVATYLLISLYGVILTMLLDSSISASLIMILGGHPYQAGSVDALVNLGAVLSAVLSAYLLSKFREYKQMFFLFGFCSLLSVVCLAVSLPAGAETSEIAIYVVLLAIFLYYFFTGSLSLPLYELLSLFVDSRSRVVVMSNCLAIGQLCSMLVSLAVSWLLNRPAEDGMESYRFIYYFAAMVAFLYFITMLRLDKVKVGGRDSAGRTAFAALYKEQWKRIQINPSLRVFMAAVILYAVSWSATGLFIGMGYRENAGRMDEIVASGIFVRTLVKAGCFYVCGQLAKRFGNKAILIAVGIVGLCSPLTAMLLPIDYYILVLVATNIVPMAYVYFLNELFERSDETTFKGLFTAFTLAAVPAILIIPALGLLIERHPALFNAAMLLIQAGGIYLVTRFGKRGIR